MMKTKQCKNKYSLFLGALLPLILLTACGGSSSQPDITENPITPPATSVEPSTPTVDTEPNWVKNQFKPSATFINQCENPRVGSSPITGESYPDTQGSELLEKHWQRAFTHETYLWYKEVIDKDPNNYNLSDYFDQLKSMEVTESGKDKDQYHWLQPTSEVEEITQLGVSYGYGISFDKQQNTAPRQWIVQNITPYTEASSAGVSRGSKLLEIDGIDFVNTNTQTDIDIINNAIFSTVEGETHTFTFIDNNDDIYQVALQTSAISGVPLQITKVIETEQGKTGYLLLNSFNNSTVEKDLFHSFTHLKEQNVNELIVDLRYNGGGYIALSSQLAYMAAGSNATFNKVYETTVYNDKIPNDTMPFINETIDLRRLIGGDSNISAGQSLPVLNLNRVYVLTTGASCSASESFMNALIGIDVEVIQIGTTTCGKPYGFVGENNCGSTYFTVQFKGENNAGFGDYPDGLIPTTLPEAGKLDQVQGCFITEDYQHDLGDEQERLLASALYYQTNNRCPELTKQSTLITGLKKARAREITTKDNKIIQDKSPLQKAIIRDADINQYRYIQ